MRLMIILHIVSLIYHIVCACEGAVAYCVIFSFGVECIMKQLCSTYI
jgi:hypothetical protein